MTDKVDYSDYDFQPAEETMGVYFSVDGFEALDEVRREYAPIQPNPDSDDARDCCTKKSCCKAK